MLLLSCFYKVDSLEPRLGEGAVLSLSSPVDVRAHKRQGWLGVKPAAVLQLQSSRVSIIKHGPKAFNSITATTMNHYQ